MSLYLTDYSITRAEMTVTRWRELGEHLIRKYNDGYVQNEPGSPENLGYPERWLRRVLADRPEQFKLPAKEADTPKSTLVD